MTNAISRPPRTLERRLPCLLLLLAAALFPTRGAFAQQAQAPPSTAILDYIHAGWETLSRSMADCHSVVDPKLNGAPSILYLPADVAVPPSVAALKAQCNVDVEHLPKVVTSFGELKLTDIPKPGLLYLPNKYVVPGGRFNEMYGWDSYFIILGLLREGKARPGARDWWRTSFTRSSIMAASSTPTAPITSRARSHHS